MILYLWIEKYKNIVKTGFNLSSDYKFGFTFEERDNLIKGLTCEMIEKPRLFHGNINSFKAIIGENGAGKTTILEFLIDIFVSNHKGVKGFLVLKSNNPEKYRIFHSSIFEFGESGKNINGKPIELIRFEDLNGSIAEKKHRDLSIIHYNPILNPDRISGYLGYPGGSSDRFETNYWHYYDITNENLMIKATNKNLGSQIRLEPNPNESELLALKRVETFKIIKFLRSDYKKYLLFKNGIETISVTLNRSNERFWERNQKYYLKYNESDPIQEVISEIIINSTEINPIELKTYIGFIYALLTFEYGNFTRLKGEENPMIDTIKLLESIPIEDARKFIKNLIHKCSSIEKAVQSYIEKLDHISNFIHEGTFKEKYDDVIIIELNQTETVDQLISLMNDFFINNIFTIDFPGMSNGEKDMISLYSRIWDLDIPKEQKEILLLLDEPDVTYHPQWQKELVFQLNAFIPKLLINKINKKINVQIIMTSHSPIVISDLPKENILFLEKEDKTGYCKVSDLKKSIPNTFGANIHSLFADAFFIKGGLIGKFAKKHIEKLVKMIQLNENPTYIKSIIELVGEPLIQNQLWALFNEKFPENSISEIDKKIIYHENELEKLRGLKK